MLIQCDECGRRISDKSVACPGCGYPTHLNKALREPENTGDDPAVAERKERDKLWAFVAATVGLLIVIAACYFIGARQSEAEAETEPDTEETVMEEISTPEAEELVATAPESETAVTAAEKQAAAPEPAAPRPAVEPARQAPSEQPSPAPAQPEPSAPEAPTQAAE